MSHLDVYARARLSERFTLDVSFSLDFDDERPIAALFGPSGSGKSTTLALIAGLLNPDEGRISFDGIRLLDTADRTRLAPEQRAIGLVAQDGLLFPHLTVSENLHFAERRSRGRARAPRGEIVEALELAPLLPRSTHTLSGESVSERPLRARSCRGRGSCFSTSRSPRWTRPRGGRP